MSQLRGIEADFATWRPVQGRKVLQLVFEVPIEKTQHVLDMLGIPQPGESKWCAIALLSHRQAVIEGAKQLEELYAPKPAAAKAERSEGGSPKKAWSEYSRSQQAAILISDPGFRDYFGCTDPVICDESLKRHFRITSKRELDSEVHQKNWDEFVALYHMHRDRHK